MSTTPDEPTGRDGSHAHDDGREELAEALFAWDVEEHDDPAPTWDDLTGDQRDVWRSAVDVVLAAGWVSPAALAGRDAGIERQGLEYAEEVASWQAQVRLLREQQAIAKAENDGLRDAVAALEGAWSECDDDRAVAERRLGAVAALADEWRASKASGAAYHGERLHAVISSAVRVEATRSACERVDPDFGLDDEGPACYTHNEPWGRCHPAIAPVSGAVEGAGGMDAAVRAACEALDERMGRFDSPGSDEVRLAIETALPYLFPPSTPVAGHEQEVRADWEYGFTYVGPDGVTRTEWGFAQEPVPDSDGEIEVNLDEWVTVTSIVRRRFDAPETVRTLAARTPGASDD